MVDNIAKEAIGLLQHLISTPSFSREEEATADIIYSYLENQDCHVFDLQNNIWAMHKSYDESKPNLLLNSHHDTVKPNEGYTINPFKPEIKDGKLFGLGSNDAGASLVGLIQTFLYFKDKKDLPFNLLFAASAEEEITGPNGMSLLREELPHIEGAIVGEPTHMHAAVAEKGLVVIDVEVRGVAGHAAREEGENAIYKAINDITRLREVIFDKNSELLGPVTKSITVIKGGTKHNVTPDRCYFTMDVRPNENYTNREVVEILQLATDGIMTPRSLRLESSSIPSTHPLYQNAVKLNIPIFGSATLSDMSVMPWPAIKMGIGDSSRSHSPDEFVFINEIEEGISKYISFIEHLGTF